MLRRNMCSKDSDPTHMTGLMIAIEECGSVVAKKDARV